MRRVCQLDITDMNADRFSNCVFSDDIRFEIGNKFSIIGVYSGEILIQGSAPQMLSRLVIGVWLVTNIADPLDKVTIRVKSPGVDLSVAEAQFDIKSETLSPDSDASKRQAFLPLNISPFPVMQDGVIEAFLDTGDSTERVGRLKVRFVDNIASQAAT